MNYFFKKRNKANETDTKKNIILQRSFYKMSDFLTVSDLFNLNKQINSTQVTFFI